MPDITLEARQRRAEAAGYSIEVVIESTGGNVVPPSGDLPEPERHRAHVTPPSGAPFSVAGGTRNETLAAALYQIEARLGL